MSQIQKIGDRIRHLRNVEDLTQEEFAYRLGVKRGYISTLETHRNEPSEQLILSICRTFGANYEWLKEGRGEQMFEVGRILSAKGRMITDEIFKVIQSPDRVWAITELAQLLHIDPDDPSKRLPFPSGFREAVLMVMRIFKEGDPRKIKAVMAQLVAFMTPFVDLDEVRKKLKEEPEEKRDGEA
jgi:transcriptional regulator with XRE-family HTH domain